MAKLIDASIFVLGRPGVGKTTLSRRLAKDIGGIRVDPGEWSRRESSKPTNPFALLRATLIYAAMAAIAIITIGTLVIPVVMAAVYSWYWLFLYIGYLVVALIAGVFIAGGASK